MGARNRIRALCAYRGITLKKLGELHGQSDDDRKNVFYNKVARDSMKFNEVEQLAEELGCELVFRDKETGRIF